MLYIRQVCDLNSEVASLDLVVEVFEFVDRCNRHLLDKDYAQHEQKDDYAIGEEHHVEQ